MSDSGHADNEAHLVEADENAIREMLHQQIATLTAERDELAARVGALSERLTSENDRLTTDLHATHARLTELGRYHGTDSALQPDVLFLLRRLKPMAVESFSKIRVGCAHDGGYVMLDDFKGVEGAYSLGIDWNVSWDRHIAHLGIDVFQYDHTIDELPEPHPRFHWRKCGLSDLEDSTVPFTTLAGAIAQNGHEHASELIMKCDIEDAEWDVFGSADVGCLAKFRQIVVEFHFLERMIEPLRYHRMLRAISALTVHHSVVHVHGNNYAPMAIISGVPFPSVLEATFVRRAEKKWLNSQETFPTRLDTPNNPEACDHYLGCFQF